MAVLVRERKNMAVAYNLSFPFFMADVVLRSCFFARLFPDVQDESSVRG